MRKRDTRGRNTQTWGDGCDPDRSTGELLSEASRHGVHSRLGRAVNRAPCVRAGCIGGQCSCVSACSNACLGTATGLAATIVSILDHMRVRTGQNVE